MHAKKAAHLGVVFPRRSKKQYKYLFQQMLIKDNIIKAWRNLRKGKTKRKEVIAIEEDFENEVEKMRDMIANTRPGSEHPERGFVPRKHKPKYIFEHGKERRIYMPDIIEQWLHHIIILIAAPIIMRTSYPFSCGSFPKRGGHYGMKQLRKWIRKAGKNAKYFAKLDIRHFYDSIRKGVLMRELGEIIKDDWFLHVIEVCLTHLKGLPLGFYISQWFANYLLEPLDWFIVNVLGFSIFERYMDDIVIMGPNKKKLHEAIVQIKIFLGRRFRLRVKDSYQVCLFHYERKGKCVGRFLDFMGFRIYRNRVTMRKSIMTKATKLAARLHRTKEKGDKYYGKHVRAMVSYMGWFDCTDTYDCYLSHIKPAVNIGGLKKIISRTDRRNARNERMERGTLQLAA